MAVHTELDEAEIAALARFFGLPPPGRFEGLAAGSINTNYRLETPSGRFFLTLREGKRRDEVEGEVALLGHLAAARFPCPRPLAGPGGSIGEARGRQVLCFPWIAGEELAPEAIGEGHTRQVGAHLGRLHVLSEGAAWSRPNPYGPETVARWLRELSAPGRPDVEALRPELEAARASIDAGRDPALPRGLGHFDLFVDNVKWIGGNLAAIFDFEMACRDALALDLAIALNAWCFGEDDRYDRPRARAFVEGYVSERPLSAAERAGLHAEARFGALRYTLSRIRDFELSPLPPERLRKKSFRRYLARLRALDAMGPAGFRELVGL